MEESKTENKPEETESSPAIIAETSVEAADDVAAVATATTASDSSVAEPTEVGSQERKAAANDAKHEVDGTTADSMVAADVAAELAAGKAAISAAVDVDIEADVVAADVSMESVSSEQVMMISWIWCNFW